MQLSFFSNVKKIHELLELSEVSKTTRQQINIEVSFLFLYNSSNQKMKFKKCIIKKSDLCNGRIGETNSLKEDNCKT
jgi:hypothetical protein